MPRYNLYKIVKTREADFIARLLEIGAALMGEMQVEDFDLRLYVGIDAEPRRPTWVDQYQQFLPPADDPDEDPLATRGHFAAFIASNAEVCYVASIGKTHFYLRDYAIPEIGIDLAERIADRTQLLLKVSRLFGGRRSKEMIAYLKDSSFDHDIGESIQLLKMKTQSPEQWGSTVSFGNSISFQPPQPPEQLHLVIRRIEQELQTEVETLVPRARPVSDEALLPELDRALGEAILDDAAGVQEDQIDISGVNIVFNEECQYRLIADRRRVDVDGDLTLQVIRDFAANAGLDLATQLDEISVKVTPPTGSPYRRPLKALLDYVDEVRHFLLGGKWYVFDQDYLDELVRQVDQITFVIEDECNISLEAFRQWQQSLPPERHHVMDEKEQCLVDRCEGLGYIPLHKSLEQLAQYKIEKADLVRDNVLFVVKVGKTGSMLHAVDQSTAVFTVLSDPRLAEQISEAAECDLTGIDTMCLWLVFDRRSRVERISEIRSLMLMIKLAAWRRQCANAFLTPVIRCGYLVP